MPALLLLSLFVIICAKHCEDAFWGPYCRSLPTYYNDPLWFSDREKEELKGTNLFAAMPEYEALLR
jgi:hypothetical protein